jgi:ketosteroid isomerase-like protein
VNSALQRARTGMREHLPAERQEWSGNEEDAGTRELVRRFTEASVAKDVDGLAAMLRDDIRCSMPPTPGLYVGRDTVVNNWVEDGFEDLGRLRAVVTSVNRQPAIAFYLWQKRKDAYLPLTIDVLRVADGAIAEIVTFHADQFPRLRLPERLPEGGSAVPAPAGARPRCSATARIATQDGLRRPINHPYISHRWRNIVNSTRAVAGQAVGRGDTRSPRGLTVTGVLATLVATVVTTLGAALARAIGVDFAVSDGEIIPVSGVAVMAGLFSLVGLVMALALRRWSARPAERFVRTAWSLTAVSLVPPMLAGADVATTLTLLGLHLVAALVMIPALARSLRTRAA